MGPRLEGWVRSTPDVETKHHRKGLVFVFVFVLSQVELSVVKYDRAGIATFGCFPRKIVRHTQSTAIPTSSPCSPNFGVSKFASSLTPQNAGPGFQNSLLAHLQPVSFISFNGVHKSQYVKSRREFMAIAKSSWSPLGGLWIPSQSVKVITEISSIFSISKSLLYI